jgi:streptomycin 6-kinase
MDLSSPRMAAARDRLQARFGELLDPWWHALPTTVAELSRRWELAVDEPVGRGNTSLVLRCRRADGRAAMLKLSPAAALAAAEAASLRLWAPSGRVPALWGHDAERGALLIEAIAAEAPLAAGGRDVPPAEIGGLIADLHRATVPSPGDGLVSLADRVEFIFAHWTERSRGLPDVPPQRLRSGRALADRLLADRLDPALLHGDLHPGNVLDGGSARGLVAIDPRPCIGEAAFDVVDWVFWPADPGRWEARAHELAAALGLESGRLWAWCSALASVLAAARATRGEVGGELEALLAIAA